MTHPKTKGILDAVLRFEAGFHVSRQKRLYLMHYYKEKQVLSLRDKKCKFGALLITQKSRFSHDATENKLYI